MLHRYIYHSTSSWMPRMGNSELRSSVWNGSINQPDKQPNQSRWIWTKLIYKTACILSEFRMDCVTKSIISLFSSSCRMQFSYYAPLPIFLQGIWLISLAHCFLVTYLSWFLQELIWFLLWLKRKTNESEFTYNLTLSCIRICTCVKLFFFSYYIFLIVNPSER